MPMMLGGFLSFTPEAGLGYSRYFAQSRAGRRHEPDPAARGAEASLKFSKDLGPYQNHQWGIDGLLHVFQPYANWSVLSTDDPELGDPMVDRLTPTTRPRPLDPVRFTAIDQMQSWNVVRLGARNRLLTKRDGQSFEWLYLNTYVDAFVEDPGGPAAIFQPLQRIAVASAAVDGRRSPNPIPRRLRRIGFQRVRFPACSSCPPTTSSFPWATAGWRATRCLMDSNRFALQTYTRLTENWGIGTRHVLELDDNTLELQQYTLHRDLGNWVAGVGLTERNNRLDQEYGIVFSLTLKDFPSVTLPFGLDAQQ